MEDKIQAVKESDKKQEIAIKNAFTPMINERDLLSIQYDVLIQKELTEDLCIEAKALRNKLVKIRTGIAEVHQTQKAFFLAGGKFVDSWKNKETKPVTQMETKLKEIENHFYKIEQEKQDNRLFERTALLSKFGGEITEDLRLMSEEVFQPYYASKEKIYKQEQIAIKKQEEERLKKIEDEKAEQKRVKDENEKLKKERDAVAKKAKEEEEERKRVESIRLEKEKKAKAVIEAERVKNENIRLAKEKVVRDAQNKVIEEEKQKTKDLEKEIQDKKDEDAKKAKEQEERLQTELNKGDTEKVKDLKNELQIIKNKFSFKSAKNKKMYESVGVLIDKVILFIK